jgi:hypothetical protein
MSVGMLRQAWQTCKQSHLQHNVCSDEKAAPTLVEAGSTIVKGNIKSNKQKSQSTVSQTLEHY